MTNKRLRIMIVERDHLQRLSIEKSLNGLGYYAITGMNSAADAVSVLHYAQQLFDWVIANSELVAEADIDFLALCRDHPFVRHTLMYECRLPVFESSRRGSSVKIQSTLSHLPDSRSMRWLMQSLEGVEPAEPA